MLFAFLVWRCYCDIELRRRCNVDMLHIANVAVACTGILLPSKQAHYSRSLREYFGSPAPSDKSWTDQSRKAIVCCNLLIKAATHHASAQRGHFHPFALRLLIYLESYLVARRLLFFLQLLTSLALWYSCNQLE